MLTHPFALILLITVASIGGIIALVAFRRRKDPSRPLSHFGHYLNGQIYVGNLSYRIEESVLKDHFAQYGDIQNIKVVRNFRTGQSKGYAFITYANAKQATKALIAHGQEFHGRSMVVRIAKPRQQQEA